MATTAPMEKLGTMRQRAGPSPHSERTSSTRAASKPEVPTTVLTPSSRHLARLPITTSGRVNSTTTSAAHTTDGSRDTAIPAIFCPAADGL